MHRVLCGVHVVPNTCWVGVSALQYVESSSELDHKVFEIEVTPLCFGELNPRPTKGFLVTLTTKEGGCHPLQIFKMNPRMMFMLVPIVSLEGPLNIDTR